MSDRKVYGVGITGTGKYSTWSSLDKKQTKEYTLWTGILSRCYSPKNLKRRPNYRNCNVSEEFKSFQKFAEWCNNQKGFGVDNFQLDKDILCYGDENPIYSAETCCFIPNRLNMLFMTAKNKSVNFHKRTGLWQANISVNKKILYLGSSHTYEGAYHI